MAECGGRDGTAGAPGRIIGVLKGERLEVVVREDADGFALDGTRNVLPLALAPSLPLPLPPLDPRLCRMPTAPTSSTCVEPRRDCCSSASASLGVMKLGPPSGDIHGDVTRGEVGAAEAGKATPDDTEGTGWPAVAAATGVGADATALVPRSRSVGRAVLAAPTGAGVNCAPAAGGTTACCASSMGMAEREETTGERRPLRCEAGSAEINQTERWMRRLCAAPPRCGFCGCVLVLHPIHRIETEQSAAR